MTGTTVTRHDESPLVIAAPAGKPRAFGTRGGRHRQEPGADGFATFGFAERI